MPYENENKTTVSKQILSRVSSAGGARFFNSDKKLSELAQRELFSARLLNQHLSMSEKQERTRRGKK